MNEAVIRELIRKSSELLLRRFERNDDYPFIDTKFDIVSGRDFSMTDEPFRQKSHVYSWIQGRGLESLAAHAAWYEAEGNCAMAARFDQFIANVALKMEECRRLNGGRLSFAMSPDGESIYPVESPAGNYSDLFYSKGLFAAAIRLNDDMLKSESEKLFRFVVDDIGGGRFHTDQHCFDPKNPVQFIAGKYPQGPRMIALSGLAVFAAAHPNEPIWCNTAAEFIRFIIRNHVNMGQHSNLEKYDFIESLDCRNTPWHDGNMILCDPGHALEFVGLASKCLLTMRQLGVHACLIDECRDVLPQLFRHVFKFGYNRNSKGIVKTFDLLSRLPFNSDMPWWNLPETIRAGYELLELYPANCHSIREITEIGLSAFFDCYVQPNGFACQTRTVSGEISSSIPALPDADPCYHTNLSFIDMLHIKARAKENSSDMEH